ncbi:MAG: peptidylprolyl isomerase [Proteobacteria bacterium]|nr:peptidylprolyl isomerase [Pseudomonadota bacterium]
MKFLFSLMILFSIQSLAAPIDRILAVVNSEIVTQSDFADFKKKVSLGQGLDDLLLLGKSTAELKKDEKLQLDYLINEKIIESEIKRLNLSVTLEKVESEIRDIAKRNGMTRAELLSAVKGQGMGVAEYQQFVRGKIERQSLIESEISSKIRVSDEDILGQFLRQYPEANAGIFEYQLAHILFNPKKGGLEGAKSRAQDVLGKLQAGGNFESLAEQNSEDTNFSQGGILGTFKSNELPPGWDIALSSVQEKGFSSLVASRAGFHILKVVQKKLLPDPRFEKEKERLRSNLYEKAFQKHFKNWLDSKREESFIRIN